jgi:molecular chaperone GrpE
MLRLWAGSLLCTGHTVWRVGLRAEQTSAAGGDDLAAQKDAEIAQLRRALADSDNQRKATRAEIAAARDYAHTALAKDMLEVVDNVERAVDSAQSHTAHSPEGLRLIARDFETRLARHGVHRIAASKGTAFDPHMHHAIAEIGRMLADEGTGTTTASTGPLEIAAIAKSGWTINGRLLRPALVTVCRKPAP